MLPRRLLVLLAVLLASGQAEPYAVRPGDTLSSLARRYNTTAAELARRNGLPLEGLRTGQVIDVPPDGRATVTAVSPAGWRVSLPGSAAPGDPVTVRVSGAQSAPAIIWGTESLVVARDGADWVGVGRELLGTAPKAIPVTVRVGADRVAASLRLRPDPRPVAKVYVSSAVLATLTEENRAIERRVLEAAYARRTPVAWSLPFSLPIPTATTSEFGSARRYGPAEPVNFHYGQDFRGAVGVPVRATNAGTVVVAGRYAIRGGLVGLDHGAGVTSLYFHLSSIPVRLGQKVARGEVVGRVGATGFVTGPHLHWEMRVRGEATDPLKWVNRRWP